jgi:nucleotide-binding universal stress UspA family protein
MNPNATPAKQTTRTANGESIFSRILVGIDGSEAGFEACRQVARLAEQDAEIDAVAVVHLGPAFAAELDAAHIDDVLERDAEHALEHAVEILGARAHKRYLNGFVTPALLAELEHFHATLLALGTHGHHRATEILIGGVAGELLHKAPCSILIARPRPMQDFPSTLVVGDDGSPQADDAVAVARRLATRFGSTMRVITALDGKDVSLLHVHHRARFAEVVKRHPVKALVEAARDADILVVGSRGLHGLQALGSVSERVAHDASCSVLVVRIAPPSISSQECPS